MKSENIVFVKQNNAISEYRAIKMSEKIFPGGNLAYLTNFTEFCYENDKKPVVIGCHHYPNHDELKVQKEDIEVFSFYFGSGGTSSVVKKLINLIFAKIKSFMLIFLIAKKEPNVIVCWAKRFPLLVTVLYSLIKKPVLIYSLHNKFSNSLLDRLELEIIKRNANKIICHGTFLRKHLLENGFNNKDIVEFAWDYSGFVTKRKKSTNSNNFLFIGRVVEQKGVFDLLYAFEAYLHYNSMGTLTYIGNGQDLSKLDALVKKKKLDDKVYLLGRLEHDKMFTYIDEARCVVIPTQRSFPEGRCMVLVESLIRRTPVICPDMEPFKTLVKHGENGLLFDADNKNALLEKMLLTNDKSGLYEKMITNIELSNLSYLFTGKPDYLSALKECLK